MTESDDSGRPGLREAVVAGGVLALVLCATAVTYARLDPAELYHVSRAGAAGGLGRALVETNYPIALAALGVVPLAVDRLLAAGAGWAAAAGILAALLCALVPLTVDQADLDARPVNAAPAAGVALAVALTVAAWRRGGLGARGRARGDSLRLALAILLAIVAVPWLFAELGFFAPDPILADEPTPGEDIPAVHPGSHHGMDGVLLALVALGLSRQLSRFHGRRLALTAAAVLSMMLAYGVGNAVQDAWNEQLVKRGTTDAEIPSVVLPAASAGWAVLVAAAAAVFVVWFGRDARYAPRSQSRHSDIGT